MVGGPGLWSQPVRLVMSLHSPKCNFTAHLYTCSVLLASVVVYFINVFGFW